MVYDSIDLYRQSVDLIMDERLPTELIDLKVSCKHARAAFRVVQKQQALLALGDVDVQISASSGFSSWDELRASMTDWQSIKEESQANLFTRTGDRVRKWLEGELNLAQETATSFSEKAVNVAYNEYADCHEDLKLIAFGHSDGTSWKESLKDACSWRTSRSRPQRLCSPPKVSRKTISRQAALKASYKQLEKEVQTHGCMVLDDTSQKKRTTPQSLSGDDRRSCAHPNLAEKGEQQR